MTESPGAVGRNSFQTKSCDNSSANRDLYVLFLQPGESSCLRRLDLRHGLSGFVLKWMRPAVVSPMKVRRDVSIVLSLAKVVSGLSTKDGNFK